MRDQFPGYYRPSDKEFKKLWQECLFVLDANVLLNLYRYSSKGRKALLDILKDVNNRVWIPYQAALEYQRSRLGVIEQQKAAYDDIAEMLDDESKKIQGQLSRYSRHPSIDIGDILRRLKEIFQALKEDLDEQKKAHEDLAQQDPIRDALDDLLDGKVGPDYPATRVEAIYKEGKTRYDRRIPPGYADVDKSGIEQHGDLILWFQIVEMLFCYIFLTV